MGVWFLFFLGGGGGVAQKKKPRGKKKKRGKLTIPSSPAPRVRDTPAFHQPGLRCGLRDRDPVRRSSWRPPGGGVAFIPFVAISAGVGLVVNEIQSV